MNELEIKVIEVLEDLCLTEIDDTAKSLADDLSLDSLRMVMLLLTLEETFGIELDESDMNPFILITVEDVISLTRKYVKAEEGMENG